MILSSLNNYYMLKTGHEGSELPKRFWSREKVVWEFRIDKEGRLVTVLSYANADKGEKFRYVFVPEHVTRSSGVKPFFLCDKASYLTGVGDRRGAEMLLSAKELHHAILDGVDDDAARAVLSFFDRDHQWGAISDSVWEELSQGGNVVFRYLPDNQLVHEREAIINAWEQQCAQPSDISEIQCSVSGEYDSPATLFPQVSGVPGAQSSGASLVSFNQDAFCSYGKSKNDQALNASISATVAFNAGTALKYLIQSRSNHMIMGNNTIVFWTGTAKPEEESELWFMLNFDDAVAQAREDAKLRDEIMTKLENIRQGRKSADFSRSTEYFILGLAPSAARLSVRFFETGTLGSLEDNLRLFLTDMEMVAPDGNGLLGPKSIRFYVRQTAPLGAEGNIPDVLLNGVSNAVIKGNPFPAAFLQLLIQRTRIDKGKAMTGNKAASASKSDVMGYRAAAIKACLIRKNRNTERKLTVKLNEDNNGIGYMLGRLFAILEKAQTDAIPGANATIRDRYIGSASSTPARVFPQLLKMSQHHIAKSDYGITTDRAIREVMKGIDGFPATLTYDEQGEFFIGYYQQKAALWARKKPDAEKQPEGDAQ